MGRLKRAGLTAKPSKYQWAKRTLEYLGHVVGNGRVSVPEAKVEALKNYVRPKTKAQLKYFLGLTGYYRRFILNYANYSKPLNVKTKMEAPLTMDWDKVSLDIYSLCCVLPVPFTSPHKQTSLGCRRTPHMRGLEAASASLGTS